MKNNKDFHVVIRRSNTFEEQRDHFIERLKDRYELTISNNEYEQLCKPHGVFHGVFGKQRRKTIGWLIIKGIKVWVLRDGEISRLATCYPPAVEHSDTEMIRACFSGMSRRVAIQIYRLYLKEAIGVSKMEFNSIKEAAIFFFTKTYFAPLHIDKYKHGNVATIKICIVINKILIGNSEYVELSLKKIKRK